MNKIFATLVKEIDRQHYLESVQAAFLLKTSGGRFPRDEEFRAAFMVKDIYNFSRRNYMLRKLENYATKEWLNIEEYTIEHIMPQNEHLSSEWQEELGPNWKEIQAQYLHTIGNLTLTGYNPELSDRPFREKRDDREGGFRNSPIRLNKELAEVEHWNEDEIKKRAGILADKAVKMWSMPQLPSEQLGIIARRMQEDHLRNMPFDIRGIFERLRNRILNLDSSLKEEIKKQYIAYKTTTNFVDIEPQKKRLLLTLNVRFGEIDDPGGLCRNVTRMGHFGNGDVQVSVTSLDQIEDVMYLIHQAFEKYTEEVYP